MCYRLLVLLMLLAASLAARSTGSHHSTRIYSTSASIRHPRSRAVRNAFERTHPCPSTGRTSGPCPNYVIDHVKPLACAGADAPENLEWQTVTEAMAKDKWERQGCK